MPETGTSGSMSGDGKRGVGHRPQVTAPILDSTSTSFTARQKCGRYRINSGQTAPSGLTGSAAFDPKQT